MIAFQSSRDGNYEIYVMNADGTEQTRLTDNSARDMNPSWSPDGRKIAFHSRRDGNNEIYIMNADGSEQRNLTNNPAHDWLPSWSPFLPSEEEKE
jgi:Tol biopolymer transport system component